MPRLQLTKSNIVILTISSLLLLAALYVFFSTENKYPQVSKSIFSELAIELKEAIDLAEEDTYLAIEKLNSFDKLPRLLENRKNYILGNLYEEISEPALAFIHYYEVESDYLSKHSQWKLVKLAIGIGFEKIVVERLNLLVKLYPKEPKFLYERAKSYLRQSLFDEAKDILLIIQESFPESDYALGADYYLANLSSDPAEKSSRFKKYLLNSPSGSFAPLISMQIIKSQKKEKEAAEEDKTSDASTLFNELKNNIALSFFHSENYQKANEIFSKISEEKYAWLEHAKALVKLKKKDSARALVKRKILQETNEEVVKEAIELLLSISPSWRDLEDMRALLPHIKIAKDKVLWHIAERSKAKSDYKAVFSSYPDSFYAPESMARVFWQEYKREAYHSAVELYQTHWKNYSHARSHSFVAYWAGKIYLKQNQEQLAKATLQALIDDHPRDYYSFRAEALLNGDKEWYKLGSSNEFFTLTQWQWPEPYSDIEIKEKYGEDIFELTNIGQHEYILALDEAKDFDKDFRMWLYAQAKDNLKAISTAYFALEEKTPIDAENIKLQYAYPMLYADLVADEASQRLRVDPMLAHALIKQESRYQPQIVSKVGAIGLMQLMPYTARAVARDLKLKSPEVKDLMQPEINIKLGVKYMEDVFQSFNNNMIYAIGSYNAGPVALKRWVRKDPNKDPDEFIEDIPYQETKGYVKKVLMNYWIYKKLYTS